MHWQAGYEHPWVVLTDLEPQQAEVSWYGMRTWVETGFKDFKRGLWGWHHSKMQEAACVERLWLAMAVAQVWTVSLGIQAEEEQCQEPLGEELPAQHIARRRRKRPAGADDAPVKLYRAWAPGVSGCTLQRWSFALRQARAPSMASDHHHSQETASTL